MPSRTIHRTSALLLGAGLLLPVLAGCGGPPASDQTGASGGAVYYTGPKEPKGGGAPVSDTPGGAAPAAPATAAPATSYAPPAAYQTTAPPPAGMGGVPPPTNMGGYGATEPPLTRQQAHHMPAE